MSFDDKIKDQVNGLFEDVLYSPLSIEHKKIEVYEVIKHLIKMAEYDRQIKEQESKILTTV